tara:strand:- start:808 stop:1527 length:720 start_codon:yes stop_codon:yes gene_type:complete
MSEDAGQAGNRLSSVDLAVQGYRLSQSQLRFFHTFGYLLLPGLFCEDIGAIGNAFDKVMADPDSGGIPLAYANGGRSMVPAILDRHPTLNALKSDPRVTGIADSVLGDDWEYAESAGDQLECETTWHRDTYGTPLTQFSIKLLFYMEPLTAATGALRVLPGTNYFQGDYVKDVLRGHGFPDRMQDVFGVPANAIPAVAVETNPGDVVVLNFRTVHASFEGAKIKRRLLNINYREPTKPK